MGWLRPTRGPRRGITMMLAEKQQLLEFFCDSSRWCQNAEAKDANGAAVKFDSADATACDLSGALCRLFGWERATTLFQQLDRHIYGKRPAVGWPPRDDTLAAMVALQEFNDRAGMTFAELRAQLENAPVWVGNRHANRSAADRDD